MAVEVRDMLPPSLTTLIPPVDYGGGNADCDGTLNVVDHQILRSSSSNVYGLSMLSSQNLLSGHPLVSWRPLSPVKLGPSHYFYF